MFELIDEIEEGLKRFLTKKGFAWLIFMVVIGFSIGKWFLSILIKHENQKLETKKTNTTNTKQRNLEQEKIDLDTLDNELPSEHTPYSFAKASNNRSLSTILQNRTFSWFLLGLSLLLSIIETFFKIEVLVGGWHIVMYLLLLLPLLHLLSQNKVVNPYTRIFVPFLLVLIVDMFYYNNQMVQHVVPIVFFVILSILYLTSLHQVHALYQTLLSSLHISNENIFFGKFFTNLGTVKSDKKVFKRILLALFITLPFFAVFLILLLSADSSFSQLFSRLLDFKLSFDGSYFLNLPLYFFLFLFLFVYSFSNEAKRLEVQKSKSFDLLIIGIFLGMINLLFLTFITLQIPFLLNENHIPEGVLIANFAREGFFQLMMVMGIVLSIFIFIMKRFKGESLITFLLSGLLFSTIIMGVVSLKKMYLYQSIKGATVLRYYVEWFDYLLLLILALGIIFLFKKIKFEKLLSIMVLLGMGSFTLIVSLNIDAMVTAKNLEKFKNQPQLLDLNALEKLSIDALPISLENNVSYPNKEWFIKKERNKCKDFAHYHFGYCSKLKALKE